MGRRTRKPDADRPARVKPQEPEAGARQAMGDTLRQAVHTSAAFASLELALAQGRNVVARGLPAGAQPALIAALAEERPLLVVAHEADALRCLAADLELLSGDRPLIQSPPLSLAQGGDLDLGAASSFAVEWGARLRVLQGLAESEAPPVVLCSATALLQRLPSPERTARCMASFSLGETLEPHDLALRLVERGYRRVALVEAPGELAIRGGIVDVYPLGAVDPIRVELFGDTIDSLRAFDARSQRSLRELDSFRLPLQALDDYQRTAREDAASLLDHLPPEAALVLIAPGACRERLLQGASRFAAHSADLLEPDALQASWEQRATLLFGRGAAEDALALDAERVDLPFKPSAVGGRRLQEVTSDLARLVRQGERLTVTCVNGAERERLVELFESSGLRPQLSETLRDPKAPPGLTLVVSPLRAGLRAPDAGLWLIPSSRLFTRHLRLETTHRPDSRRDVAQGAVESFADLQIGQPVVHVSHGIALFNGIVRRELDGQPRDFLQLEFDGSTLFIPTDRIGLVRRYVGPTSRRPKLSKIGGKGWKNKTKKAAEAVRDLAAELLEVQAERMVQPGFAFPPDDREQLLFHQSFGYTDTPDQLRVTEEIRGDMCAPRAMDRVVCGDVGYGKTELSIRAAFRCIMAGRQVAVLAPTTVLAHQHHRVFRERLAAYPVRVDVISRFCTSAQQRESVRDAKDGKVDVLIGTHRLLSKDVSFKDLGLVVVDEEQRFGVEHKERIKSFCRTVDLLTLTATPIPRTLHMALSGARDISVLQTAPPGRSPVETRVVRFDRPLIKRAIERELARDGQVYFVHDRVRTIERMSKLVRDLVPTARVLVVHGQLPERQIEERMLRFFNHEVDVLVATTLIENGLDVRRANTLIVDRSDRFGLSELHQIRGRVGRSSVRAYAFLLLDEHRVLSEVAERRLRAIQEFTDLGAGFHIAMRDLEIRGAGNVLGAQQSGHIVNVGYDLYCRLLKRAMAELTGELTGRNLDLERALDLDAGEVQVVLDIPAFVPDAYVADAALKIDCYRKLAGADRESILEELADELRDRYGPLPRVLKNLFTLRRLRIRAAGHGILKITRQDRVLKLHCRHRGRLEAGIRAHHKALRRIDGRRLYVRMRDVDAPDQDQLTFLLELLSPLPEKQAPAQPPIHTATLRQERQRRLRAKQAREEGDHGDLAVLEPSAQPEPGPPPEPAPEKRRKRRPRKRGDAGGRLSSWKF